MRILTEKLGNFGIMTAILMPLLIMAAGSAIDLTNALSEKTRLQDAADAAALGVLNTRSATIKEALSNGSSSRIAVAETEAKNLFYSNIPSSLNVEKFDAVVEKKGNILSSKINFKVSVPTTLMSMFGIPSVKVGGYAEATNAADEPYDFYIFLDNSPSMGIGATQADISKLEKQIGCAFTCHNLGVSNGKNTYKLARGAGISVRIDMVANALGKMIARAKDESYPMQYRMALYTAGRTAATAKLTQLRSMTYDLASVAKAATEVELMSLTEFGEAKHWLTDYDALLGSVKDDLITGKSDRKQIVILISDGMNDSQKSPGDCRKTILNDGTCWQPINKKYCDEIKETGAQIAIMYTTFLPINDDNYRKYIAPWQPAIPAELTECASSGLFFEISFTAGVEEALNAMFTKIMAGTRLIQ